MDVQKGMGQLKKRWESVEIGPLPPTLILIGVSLYFYSFVRLQESPFERIIHDIAISCFILGAFSLLIELGHIKEYISRRLRDVVMKREYLQMLDAAQLDSVKEDIDSILFGRGTLEEGTLFRFMDDLRSRYLGSNFRENSRDFVTLENDTENSNAIRVKRVLTYSLIKGEPIPEKHPLKSQMGKDLPEEMPLGSSWAVDVIADLGNDLRKYLLKTKATIRSAISTDEFVLSALEENVIQVSATEVSKERNPPVRVETRSSAESDIVGWRFEYKPPWFSELQPGEKTEITLEEELRLGKEDILYVGAREPTKCMTVMVTAPKGFICRGAPFGLVTKQSRVLKQGENEVVIVFDDWILPGHGWAVVWFQKGEG